MTRMTENDSQMLPEVVTASRVSSSPTTVQGWRPTSVTTQPASSAIRATTPATAAPRRNQRLLGRSRRRHQASPNQAARPSSRNDAATMIWKDRWTMLTRRSLGRTAGGTASRPRIRVERSKPASSDAPSGTWIP